MNSYKLILLDNPIIVSDKKIEAGDGSNVLQNSKIYSNKMKSFFGADLTDCQKVIAQSHQIDWNGLEVEFEYVDIEKLALIEVPELLIWGGFSERFQYDTNTQVRKAFIQGFKKAQELNNKKFSLEDMIRCSVEHAKYCDSVTNGIPNFAHWCNYEGKSFIQSLSQPKVFSIEVEMEGCSDCHLNDGYIHSPNCCKNVIPKITEGKIKITKKL